MAPAIHGTRYLRRGSALLWSAEALAQIATPAEAVSVRHFCQMSGDWPADLPSADGYVLVVAGLEGCLDALTPDDALTWLEDDLRHSVLGFQDEYAGEAGLVFWLPTGRQRIRQNPATGEYLWRCAAPNGQVELPLGRALWGGAEGDARRILLAEDANPDPDGAAWAGLHHPRIS